MTPVVLKFGGELLETPERLSAAATLVARAGRALPLVVVHGGGREIDAALARAGLSKRQVDGIRVTDGPTMAVVVEVLAGAVNTRFVAAVNAAGGRAVGLTGADAGIAEIRRSGPFRTVAGDDVDLGHVGVPAGDAEPALLVALTALGYAPIVASVAADAAGTLLNVNADTLAGDLAARLRAARLVIAGGTPGVLDETGRTIPSLDGGAVEALIASGVANAGMVAKLRACRAALAAGVGEVVLADGRDLAGLDSLLTAPPGSAAPAATRLVA